MKLVAKRPRPLIRVAEYRGQSEVVVTPTQLVSNGLATVAEQRRILQDWVDFFSSGPSPIRRISIWSRVPQVLVDALAGQRELVGLELKWGEYSDLTALAGLTSLEQLSLRGAKKVTDLSPLRSLQRLRSLTLDEIHLVTDLSPLGSLTGLQELSVGNAYPGSDKVVPITQLEWVRPLTELRTLTFPGSRFLDPDFSAILELPKLTTLGLPVRQAYRAQVFELAEKNRAFAGLAQEYLDYEQWRAELRDA